MASSVDMKQAWRRLKVWLSANIPGVLETMNPGATDAEIVAYENAIERALPDDVRQWFRLHDGQDDDADGGLIFNLCPISLAESLHQWTAWLENEAMNSEIESTSLPAGAIQRLYTSRGWIPLTHDFGGNFLGVDLDPGPNGTVGQVINFGRDESTKCVAATSWAQFIEWIAAEYERGRLVFESDDEGFLMEEHSEFGHRHLHEVLVELHRAGRLG